MEARHGLILLMYAAASGLSYPRDNAWATIFSLCSLEIISESASMRLDAQRLSLSLAEADSCSTTDVVVIDEVIPTTESTASWNVSRYTYDLIL